MTESEAIDKLKNMRLFMQIEDNKNECKFTEDDYAANKMALQALEEVQQYRQIGTVEECREAVEKQTARKPDYEGDGYSDGQLVYDTWICPSCGQYYEVDYDDYDYCPECGQHIDKSMEQEGER